MRRIILIVPCLPLIAMMVGCSEDTMEMIKDPLKKPTVRVPEPEEPEDRGGIELTLDEPVKTSGCYASLHTFQGERPSVLKITSYANPAQEDFPSVMLMAQVTVDSADALAGSTIQAELYVMKTAESEAWHSPPGSTVEILITSASGNKIEGEIVSGSVVNPLTGATSDVSGKFGGSL